MFIRQGTQIPNTEKLTELKELEYVSKTYFVWQEKATTPHEQHFLFFLQLRDEIIENFDDVENMPFCESNWKKLVQWKWNENITDDQAQTLTTRVCVMCLLY